MQVRRNKPRASLRQLQRYNNQLFNDPQVLLQKRLTKISNVIEIKNLKPLPECRYKDLQWNFTNINDEAKFFANSGYSRVNFVSSYDPEREKIKQSFTTDYKQDMVEDKYRSDKAIHFNFKCTKTKYNCEKEFDDLRFRIIVNLGTEESILCHPKFLKFAENRFQIVNNSIIKSEESQRELSELKREKNDRLALQEDEKLKNFQRIHQSKTDKPGSIFDNLIRGVNDMLMKNRSEKLIKLNSMDQTTAQDLMKMKFLNKEDEDDEVDIKLLFNDAQKFINERLFKKSELKFLSKKRLPSKEEESTGTSKIVTLNLTSMPTSTSGVQLPSKKLKKIFRKLSSI